MPSKKPVLEFLRVFHTSQHGEAVLAIRYEDSVGVKRTTLVPATLKHYPPKIADHLNGLAAKIDSNAAIARQQCREMLEQASNPNTGRIVEQPGWYPVGSSEPSEFVLPDRTLAKKRSTGEPAHFHRHYFICENSPRPRGSLKGWRSGLKRPCKESAYLVFALAAAFTGPALQFFSSKTGLLFNFAGPSGSGKTTLLRAAQSTLRRVENTDLTSLSMTKAGLEERSMQQSCLILCLDEFGAVLSSPKETYELIMALAYSTREGRGKARSSRGQQLMGMSDEAASWTTTALTTSEHSLVRMMGNNTQHIGALIRFVDIHVPSLEEGGIFASALTSSSVKPRTPIRTRVLARKIEETIESNYGIALPEIAAALLNDKQKRARLQIDCDEFVDRARQRLPQAQLRFLEAFGKVYAAGMLAIREDVSPFGKKRLRGSLDKILDASIERKEKSPTSFVKCIEDLITLGEDAKRCTIIQKGESVNNRTGKIVAVRRKDESRDILFVLLDTYQKVVPQSLRKELEETLRANMTLLVRGHSATSQMKIEGLVDSKDRPSGYKFDWDKLKTAVRDQE